jgi:hypothetical protein
MKAAGRDKIERIMASINYNTELRLLNIYFRRWKLKVMPD